MCTAPGLFAAFDFELGLALYLQFIEYPFGIIHLSGFYVGNYHAVGVDGICQWQAQVFGIYPFCYFAEYATCHQPTGSRKPRFLNGDDATVFRRFRREVSAKAD